MNGELFTLLWGEFEHVETPVAGALIAGIVGFLIGWTFGAVVGGQREFGIGFCVLFGVGYEVYRDTGGDSFLPEDRSYEEPDALQNGESASPEE